MKKIRQRTYNNYESIINIETKTELATKWVSII
jgi:hypothetical protein